MREVVFDFGDLSESFSEEDALVRIISCPYCEGEISLELSISLDKKDLFVK